MKTPAMNNPQEKEQSSPENENLPPPAKIQYPPGYRFMPTDAELVMEYLMKKINNEPIPIAEINETYLRLVSPKELTEKFPKIGDNEWYFFTPRDRKYPNGTRPDRGSESGYWKATGADKDVMYKDRVVGFRKALVFYQGKPQKGHKTNWIMHEYRVDGFEHKKRTADDMRLDDWVLCRLYEKARAVTKKPNGNSRVTKRQNGKANCGDAEDENPLRLQNSHSEGGGDDVHKNDDDNVEKFDFAVEENQYSSYDYDDPLINTSTNYYFGDWSTNDLLLQHYDSLPSMEDPVLINGGQLESYNNYDNYNDGMMNTVTYLNEEEAAVGYQYHPNDHTTFRYANSYPTNNTNTNTSSIYRHIDVEGGNVKRCRYKF